MQLKAGTVLKSRSKFFSFFKIFWHPSSIHFSRGFQISPCHFHQRCVLKSSHPISLLFVWHFLWLTCMNQFCMLSHKTNHHIPPSQVWWNCINHHCCSFEFPESPAWTFSHTNPFSRINIGSRVNTGFKGSQDGWPPLLREGLIWIGTHKLTIVKALDLDCHNGRAK